MPSHVFETDPLRLHSLASDYFGKADTLPARQKALRQTHQNEYKAVGDALTLRHEILKERNAKLKADCGEVLKEISKTLSHIASNMKTQQKGADSLSRIENSLSSKQRAYANLLSEQAVCEIRIRQLSARLDAINQQVSQWKVAPAQVRADQMCDDLDQSFATRAEIRACVQKGLGHLDTADLALLFESEGRMAEVINHLGRNSAPALPASLEARKHLERILWESVHALLNEPIANRNDRMDFCWNRLRQELLSKFVPGPEPGDLSALEQLIGKGPLNKAICGLLISVSSVLTMMMGLNFLNRQYEKWLLATSSVNSTGVCPATSSGFAGGRSTHDVPPFYKRSSFLLLSALTLTLGVIHLSRGWNAHLHKRDLENRAAQRKWIDSIHPGPGQIRKLGRLVDATDSLGRTDRRLYVNSRQCDTPAAQRVQEYLQEPPARWLPVHSTRRQTLLGLKADIQKEAQACIVDRQLLADRTRIEQSLAEQKVDRNQRQQNLASIEQEMKSFTAIEQTVRAKFRNEASVSLSTLDQLTQRQSRLNQNRLVSDLETQAFAAHSEAMLQEVRIEHARALTALEKEVDEHAVFNLDTVSLLINGLITPDAWERVQSRHLGVHEEELRRRLVDGVFRNPFGESIRSDAHRASAYHSAPHALLAIADAGLALQRHLDLATNDDRLFSGTHVTLDVNHARSVGTVASYGPSASSLAASLATSAATTTEPVVLMSDSQKSRADFSLQGTYWKIAHLYPC